MGNATFKPRNTARAKTLRNNASTAERRLWTCISNRQLQGFKFSRQMPIGPYFADFLCRECLLIVEIDGYSHDLRMEYDARRNLLMRENGYEVLRFSNADVMERLDGVLHRISEALEAIAAAHPRPLPQAGGESL